MDNHNQNFDKECKEDTKKIPALEEDKPYLQSSAIEQNDDANLEDLKQTSQASLEEPEKGNLIKSHIAINIVVAVFSVILIVIGAGCFYVDGMLNKLNFVENTQ